MKSESDPGFAMRLGLYLLGVGALFEGIVLAIRRIGWNKVLLEGQIIENSELGFLVLMALGFLFLATRPAAPRGLYILLSCLAGAAVLRENNNEAWYHALGPAKWIAVSIVIGTVLVAFRRALPEQFRALFRRVSFLLFLIGFVIAVGWAQLISQKELLNGRSDRMLEESLELAGYFLILAGLLEEYLAYRSPRRDGTLQFPDVKHHSS